MYEEFLNQLKTEANIRNLRASSIEAYTYIIKYFLAWITKPVTDLSCEDVRRFVLFKRSAGTSAATINQYIAGIKFFFKHVLKIAWDEELVPRMKLDHKLPVVLTLEEVDRLLDAATNLKHKAILSTMYSSGLRVSEVLHLHCSDIIRKEMKLHIRDSKNRTDRYTILSKRNLQLLEKYWYNSSRSRDILFPSQYSGSYLAENSVARFMGKYAKKAGITKNVHPHCLRHSFASHLYEAGVDIRHIQALLGHKTISSTEIYLHISNKTLMGIKSPFDTVR